ncbi:LuxR C-terminal-related transcriptional regulator [Yersinia nurmii]|uniref:LuxR C-terminal-related transcriptional regulator n=1 Tax=Yersinia nurmii TaxID=685706 RepID=A0AAW7K2F3_9GAMM|nr:LuxR C-terminal-related transcriptional regulator [Yersinia nurmii]MDN0089293.1 LuxR C-terminal-related transcriptional regulator [Yersinia nurmii]CNE76469.1 LuxR family regulatory protein [Yersinia nurmii]
MKKVVLIDPCRFSRVGVEWLINSRAQVALAQTNNLVVADAQIKLWRPQLVIADLYPYFLEMHNPKILESLLRACSYSKLLVYLNSPSPRISKYLLDRGAWKVITKQQEITQLEKLLDAALCNPMGNYSEPPLQSAPVLFSHREESILHYWQEGLPNKQIAKMLNIHVKTVYTHKRNIRLKLGASNRLSLYLDLANNQGV